MIRSKLSKLKHNFTDFLHYNYRAEIRRVISYRSINVQIAIASLQLAIFFTRISNKMKVAFDMKYILRSNLEFSHTLA